MPRYIFNLTVHGVVEAGTFQAAFTKVTAAAKEMEEKATEGEPILRELKIDAVFPGLHVPIDRI